jgi:HSP20 family molecular chaperone IbpA
MQKRISDQRASLFLATRLVLAASVGLFSPVNMAWGADNKSSDASSFTEKLKEWENKMSDAFRDTWKGFNNDKNSKGFNRDSLAMASVDLREQPDNYIVRLNLPGRDLEKVEISLAGDTLRIISPAEGTIARYEQSLVLDHASNAKPTVDRRPKDNLIVVTVPKASGPALAGRPFAPAPGGSLNDWDRDVLNEMNRMQREMDRIFNQGFGEFRGTQKFGGFFDQFRFDSSLDLQEENGSYVVRAYLPNHAINNVKVTVEGNVLRVESKDVPPNGTNPDAYREAHYSQMLTLPGPVRSEKMKVDHKENMLIVTLPKK